MATAISQEKTYKVLEHVAKTPHVSQRELASSTGFSLGLVNLILKRLIETGHIKVANLNSRKVEYLLTRKGVTQKTKRTYSYLSQTIQTFLEYRGRLGLLLDKLISDGQEEFVIVGEGEVAALTEMALRESKGKVKFRHLAANQSPRSGEMVLDCRQYAEKGTLGVSILTALLKEKQNHANGANE